MCAKIILSIEQPITQQVRIWKFQRDCNGAYIATRFFFFFQMVDKTSIHRDQGSENPERFSAAYCMVRICNCWFSSVSISPLCVRIHSFRGIITEALALTTHFPPGPQPKLL